MKFGSHAFKPFFDSRVRIDAVRGETKSAVSLRACVMPIADDEPLTDFAAASRRKRFSVLVQRTGDNSCSVSGIQGDPTIGDEITTEYGVTMRVDKVMITCEDWFELEATA